MQKVVPENFHDLFARVFNAKKIGAYGRLIYCAILAKAASQGTSSLAMRSKELADATSLSQNTVKRHIRELSKASLLTIEDLSHSGFHITLSDLKSIVESLPNQDQALQSDVDIEGLDFFAGRKYVRQLLARQNGRCIYTLKPLTEDTSHLDHLVSSLKGGDNSYRNIVACTFEANTRKGSGSAADFLRLMFREALLSEEEFKLQLQLIDDIATGVVRPEIS